MIQSHDIDNAIKQPIGNESGDFEVNKFNSFSPQLLVPFKNANIQHFAIVLYFNKDQHLPNDDYSGFLIFKSPGELNKADDAPTISDGFYIQFTENFLLKNRQLLSIITSFPFFEISLLKNKSLKINSAQTEAIKELYNKIFNEYHCTHSTDRFEIVNLYLQAFLLNVKRIYESHSNTIEPEKAAEKSQSGDIVRKFKSLVWLHTISINDKDYNRKTVTEYADLLFIHPNYLYAIVKKETGKTAREYIDEQIFKLAKSLLLQEELLIKEIAWQLSFSETAHFSNFFRRHAGIAPGVFRKQCLRATA